MSESWPKNPLGPRPRWLHEELRRTELITSIRAYWDAGMGEEPLVEEWIRELADLYLALARRNKS